MSVVAITSSRTSPGATTLAAGLAISWSHAVERSLLIEADPAGGVLALRFDLAPAPSLTSFGSDIRNGFDQQLLWTNTQDLRGVACMPAPVDPVLARSWVERVTPDLVAELPHLGAAVVIDLGWIDEDGASAKLAEAADVTLVVTRPDVAEIQALLFQVRRLERLDTEIALVCIGDGPNDPAEVARIAGIRLAAVLPDDQKIAAALSGAKFSAGKFKRSLLWRTIGGLGESLLDETLLQSRSSSSTSLVSMTAHEGDGYNNLVELPGAPAAHLAPAPTAVMPPPPSAASIAAALATNHQTPAPAPTAVMPPPPSAASIAAALNPICQTPTPAPTPQSIARALTSAAEMAQILADAPASAPQSQQSSPAPATPVPSPPTVISLTSTPSPATPAAIDPGLFEDTRRMLDRMPSASLILPNGKRTSLVLGSTLTIGRHSTCDVVLNDSQVSRRHGRLVSTTDGWHYSDLGSRNGTEINGHVTTDALLGSGDVLTIGRTQITFDTTSQREMECA